VPCAMRLAKGTSGKQAASSTSRVSGGARRRTSMPSTQNRATAPPPSGARSRTAPPCLSASTAPHLLDGLEAALLGLRHEAQHEQRGKDAADAIEPIGEAVVERGIQRRTAVEHREGLRHYEIRDPLRRDGD